MNLLAVAMNFRALPGDNHKALAGMWAQDKYENRDIILSDND